MAHDTFLIDPDITRAETLPSRAYSDAGIFDRARTAVFAPSWQFIADTDSVKVPGQTHPVTLLEGCLDEPVLVTRDLADHLHCLSNVCTHRGTVLCEHGGRETVLTCRYHGRRFALDGTFRSMPEFEGAVDFPSERDDLPKLPFGVWGKYLFASLEPTHSLDDLLAPMRERLAWFPLDNVTFDPTLSRDYLIGANWALYCDNYLEGFHIPYVHASLSAALDYSQYTIELYPFGSLQLGIAKAGEDCFDLPATSVDYGQRVAAYYFWLFPNTMFNVYPWGISVNVVRPLAVDRTRVSFLSYVADPSRLGSGAGTGLDRVEREDEAVVEAVQRGVRSRLYDRGRYSPTREQGVHHFHRLLAGKLASATS